MKIFFGFALLLNIGAVLCHPRRNQGGPGAGPWHQRRLCEGNQVFHKETMQCFPAGLQGPCGDNMILIPDRNRQGMCKCRDSFGCEYWPFVFSEEERRCYPLYEQGPCKENEWLVHMEVPKRRPGSPGSIRGVCQARKCPNKGVPGRIFPHRRQCYDVGTQGFCTTPGEAMYFPQDSDQPKCFPQPPLREGCQAAPHGGGSIQIITSATPAPLPAPALSPVKQGAPLPKQTTPLPKQTAPLHKETATLPKQTAPLPGPAPTRSKDVTSSPAPMEAFTIEIKHLGGGALLPCAPGHVIGLGGCTAPADIG